MNYTSRIDLSDHVRKQASALLQARLSDALDLEAQAKQAHWNVKGPHFLQLHQLFDAVHDEIEQFVDLLAERITTLGHVADGRVTTTASATTLYGYPLEATGGEAHLKAITVPVLIQHGDDDQIVPIAHAAELAIKLLSKGTLKVYPGLPHGMASTHPEVINSDILAFIRS